MDLSKDLDPVVNEKMKKNLVYVSCFSIIMLFAGLTSAYIVSMGDAFWLQAPLPIAFWWSTACIALSSMTFIFSIGAARQGKGLALKTGMSATFILGLLFLYFQWAGFGQLMDRGVHPFQNHILVTDGRYGDYFEIKKNDAYVTVNGNDYMIDGKKMSKQEFSDLQNYMREFISGENFNNKFRLITKGKSKEFKLIFNNQELMVKNQTFFQNDTTPLESADILRLKQLSQNVVDGRGDFFATGKIGEDFNISYKGEKLQYKNRKLYYQNKVLSNFLQIKATESSDMASSFLFILTFLHLLHIAGALIYFSGVYVKTLLNTYGSENYLTLKLTGIFWHFLGLLWGYLILFLVFIH
jgi:cytochrome c oxidase subunit 3